MNNPIFTDNTDLKPYNTFGLSAKARKFVSFNSVDQLLELLKMDEFTDSTQRLILGGGSNILLTQDFEGLVVKNDIKGITTQEEGDHTFVKVGAGEVWHEFVLWSIDQGLGGLENMSLIPGSVGAAPMQNIGAYGKEIKDHFTQLEAIEIGTGQTRVFNNAECEFGYRSSVFKTSLKDKYIITSVTFKLSRTHQLNTSYGAIEEELAKLPHSNYTIKDVSNAVIAIRSSKLPDPAKIGNSGSFFKNPVIETMKYNQLKEQHPNIPGYPAPEGKTKVAAGWLIEQAGWKGKTFDNYGVHKKQALVLVNYGGAEGQQIYDLSEKILISVQEQFGILLEREVNII